MLTTYERHLVLRYLANAVSSLHRDCPEAQVERVWLNIEAVLADAEMSADNIVRTITCMLDAACVPALAAASRRHLGADHKAASTTIVVAGDLAPYTEGLMEEVAEQWSSAPHILYVLGNHEFYGTEIDETRARLATECAGAGIHLLDPGMVHIEGVRFIGAALWTDLLLEGKADEIGAHMRVGREISDFRGTIQHQGRDFPTGESVARHRTERAFIERELEEAEHAGDRAVVITHHAPSPKSIRRWFEGDPFNCAFASNLDRVIDRYQPELWIHGHMHDPVDERLGKTRLLANPAGYRHEAKRGFDLDLCTKIGATV